MTSLTQAMLSHAATGRLPIEHDVSQFSAAEIRQTIADLTLANQFDLADALSAAGLSLYPQSEDILAISALLAEVKQDWAMAEDLLRQLMALQNSQSPAVTWQHLIRVLRCQCEPGQALAVAQQALTVHPHDPALREEMATLKALIPDPWPVAVSPQLH